MSCCHPGSSEKIRRHVESCCSGQGFSRRFVSKREEMEKLEKYRDQLKNELEGLDEFIKEFKPA